MKLDRDTVSFKSLTKWYNLEESGKKPNTVRWLDAKEYSELVARPPNRIRIKTADHTRSFSRILKWWGVLDEYPGKDLVRYLVMFCWWE